MKHSRKIAVFLSFSGSGGVEKMMLHLCKGFAAWGYPVDLLMIKTRSRHLEALPPGVNPVKLGAAHTIGSLPALVRYLRRERPVALLAAKERANRVALAARALAGVDTRVVVRMGTTISTALENKGSWRKWSWYLPMRLFYPLADEIVAVSAGVADDMARITGLSRTGIQVIANPVVTPELARLARQPAHHPWLTDPGTPVVLGMGRLTRQKGFDILLEAFARLRGSQPARLMILGDGPDRADLLSRVKALGIGDDVSLEGFVANPYPYLAGANLFVLASRWEGSPNVLTEALSLGTPVVATDCPSGPREILAGGRYGPLVPLEDPAALARAMTRTLAEKPNRAHLRVAAADYTLEKSSHRYLAALLGRDPDGQTPNGLKTDAT